MPPGDWLRDPRLTGLELDVVIRNASLVFSGKYDNMFAVTDPLPSKIKSGKYGVIDCRIGPDRTKHRLKVMNLFPVTTNEFPDAVTGPSVQTVLQVWNMSVIVVGPDNTGSTAYIGRAVL
ncbi:hypothetical protein B0H10DRAFT_2245125 [Mycena sp. CBHHK59/15]|nr:hypothetical protein B0H10DRAFT_2245125 [Mycena sp. CBHHK59/15]